ncbi:MAG: hypothetical protein HW416_3638, partial [Chloroflexi bacterium]|nr:hypothetical protein [Chloroflexota bacterium]
VLGDPEGAHLWSIDVPSVGDLRVVMSDLPADYRIYLYGPDRSLVGLSDNPGRTDEVVEVGDAAAGRYQLVVDSPRGEAAGSPYQLTWSWSGEAANPAVAAAPTAVVAAPGVVPAARTVILTDNFDNVDAGRLPRTVQDTGGDFVGGYEGGAYIIRKVTSIPNRVWAIRVPVPASDGALEIDVRIVGDTDGRHVSLYCRSSGAGANRKWYRFIVNVDRGTVQLIRTEGTASNSIGPVTPSDRINRGNSANRLGLSCVGDRIVGTINGEEVAVAHDSHFTEGTFGFAGGSNISGPFPGEFVFDNLVATVP